MNGATALPCVSTMRPPKTASMSTMGSSQYFFRIRRKTHNSLRIEIIAPSELVSHRVWGRTRRSALEPVGIGLAVDSQPEQILAERPEHERYGSDGPVEEQGHDHGGDESLQEEAQSEPQAVERAEHLGPDERGNEEHDGHHQGPGPQRAVAHERPEREECEHSGDR